MANSQSLVVAGRNCDDSVFLFSFFNINNVQLKTDYNNKTRYGFDINNILRSWKITKKQNIKPGEYINDNKKTS